MAYLDNFYLIIGKTIMECQLIELDIKLIYADMLLDFNKIMKILGVQVENVRFDILKHFGRI